MTTETEYRPGTVVRANVLIDSITTISVQLMRRDETGLKDACWVSAVPIGPVGVYVVADSMVNVLEVLFEPEPEQPRTPDEDDHVLIVQFPDEEMLLVRQDENEWRNPENMVSYSWDSWLELWRGNRATVKVEYYTRRT